MILNIRHLVVKDCIIFWSAFLILLQDTEKYLNLSQVIVNVYICMYVYICQSTIYRYFSAFIPIQSTQPVFMCIHRTLLSCQGHLFLRCCAVS